jgi:hypothetical protein
VEHTCINSQAGHFSFSNDHSLPTQQTSLWCGWHTCSYARDLGFISELSWLNKFCSFPQLVRANVRIITATSYPVPSMCSHVILLLSCYTHWTKHNFYFSGSASHRGLWPPRSTRFRDHTQRRATLGRTPLDEWSARRRGLYLTTHTKDKHPCLRWDSNPQLQEASSRRPTPPRRGGQRPANQRQCHYIIHWINC